jgi:cytochrome c-type biogenesis protein CcmE
MELPGRLGDAARLARSPLPEAILAAWASAGLLAAPFLWRSRSRLRLALRVGATVVALGVACGLFLDATMARGHLYRHVDEVLANRDAFEGRGLYVHGCVVEGSIEQARGTNRFRFWLGIGDRDGQALVPHGGLRVTYEGLVPDTFQNGSEIVVKGELRPDGTLAAEPDGLLAKCPGKYELNGLRQPPPRPCAL